MDKALNIHNEVWIGLLGLYPLKNNTYIQQNEGAYANVLILAFSEENFLIKAKEFVESLDFEIFEYEDIEPVKIRLQNYVLNEQLSKLYNKIKITGCSQISDLQVFDK